jgi:hypothetical protein
VGRRTTEVDRTSTVKVFEDVLSIDEYQKMFDIVDSRNISWYFFNNCHDYRFCDSLVDSTTYGFIHNFFDNGNITSDYLDLFTPLLDCVSQHYGCNVKLVRMKMNMTINVNKQVQLYPHVDNLDGLKNNNFKTAVYYINDSDGDTLFFDDEKNIVHRQTPKQNTLVLFDGDLFHAPQLPLISPKRLVLNINVILDR